MSFKLLSNLTSRLLLSAHTSFIPNLIARNCSNKSQESNKDPPPSFRHNYPEQLEGAVNHQILSELNAGMAYLSISVYYGRTSISLPGCQLFYKSLYLEELDHANIFIDYQLLRGGHVKLYPLTVPEDQEWSDITVSLAVALEFEKGVKEQLEELYKVAEKYGDHQLAEMISDKFVPDQNEDIRELGRLLTRAKRLVDAGGIGRHLFDKEIFAYITEKVKQTPKPIYT